MKSYINRVCKILIRWPLYLWFLKRGVVRFRWDRLYDDFKNDFLYYKKASFKQKMWAYKRGFISERIARYGLSETNFTDFISDIDFYTKDMYKNKRFRYWFDDKLTTWYILQPFADYMPEHYYSIENHKIRQLNATNNKKNNAEEIILLLREKRELAFKSTFGGHGKGFLKISYTDNKYCKNNDCITEIELKKLLKNLNGYIITEFVKINDKLRTLCGQMPCVVRLVTIYDDEDGPQIIGSVMRIETNALNMTTDNDGTIHCGINIQDGSLFSPKIRVGDESVNEFMHCNVHPVTGVRLEGQIPGWSLIVKKCTEISHYLNNTPFLSFDIVPTNGGFKILEINQHGMPRMMQPFYPFYKNKYFKRLFAK